MHDEPRRLPDDLAAEIAHAMDHPETLVDATEILELDDPELAADLREARSHPERRTRMVLRAQDHFADPANVEAYRAEADAISGSASIARPSPGEWEAFKTRALADLGLTYAELEQQARDSRFTSTAARQLWIVIGDERSGGREQ